MNSSTFPVSLRRPKCPHEDPVDQALAALTQLLDSERHQAQTDEPGLIRRVDPGRIGLFWFATGASCEFRALARPRVEGDASPALRQIASAVLAGSAQSNVDPLIADMRMIELFESAGAEAARACATGDTQPGHYLDALRVSDSYRR